MTPQHPAAPETETDANGRWLTDAEDVLLAEWWVSEGGDHEDLALDSLATVVERIVAERVRVVKGERDALAWAEMLTHQECADKKHPDWFIDSEHNILCPWCRAESAEAAHEAEKAAHERRVKRAEALLDAWEHDAPGLVDPVFAGRLREVLRRDPAPVRLRGDDALGGGEAR